ncbi:MAG: GNAT family N-acetyltransferase [Planctomycetes bacterium]|nr:GNAT family N-acetyltransferase [Planctomycetota bacterium]
MTERLTPDDWERYRAVRLRGLEDAPDAFWMTFAEEVEFDEQRWRERLDSGATFVVVQEESDVGVVTGAEYEGRDGCAGLFGMWVAPEARGTGASIRLVGEVVTWARAEGFKRLLLDVADENHAAIKLYERMGFKPTGRTAHMPMPRAHILEHERALEL